MTFPLKLLRIVLGVREKWRHVEHYFTVTERVVDGFDARLPELGVQSSPISVLNHFKFRLALESLKLVEKSHRILQESQKMVQNTKALQKKPKNWLENPIKSHKNPKKMVQNPKESCKNP